MQKKFKKVLSKKPKIGKKSDQEENKSSKVPRITNETVASHREEVIGSARKYIYPLQHSRYRIVLISVGLAILLFVGFFTYSVLSLYKFQNTSEFIYRVSQVVPFPIARAGSDFVAYEDYLFELRRYTHYYENQLNIDFDEDQYKPQLEDFKGRAMDKVVNDAYVKQLAEQEDVNVADREVDEQLEIVRSQNRLGGDEEVFERVLSDYWGWSVDDFKRSLRKELMTQKVAAKLDDQTTLDAKTALSELGAGKSFAKVAEQYSEDESTKENGGEFGYAITRTDRNLSAQTTNTLFSLDPGNISGIINTGYTLEIVKTLKKEGNKVRGAHILFVFDDISKYINDFKEQRPAKLYITPPESAGRDEQNSQEVPDFNNQN